ncbi:hypothetical protein N0464_08505 [Pseudomonas aeruginosa]|nr:hypothetical protein [Pseudomonas aeruginosa]
MTDHAELRRLAEACDVSRCADEGEERRRLHDFYDCVEPELILSMLNEIAENDSVVAVWRGRTQRTEEERDRLKAENEALRKDAERWRYARTILPYEVIQDAQKDLESWNVGVSEAENKRCDEAIDAALKGATQ